MADVDIEVESNDLKVAIEMLEGYEAAFIKMVNSVQTESNRMNRAAKATAAEVQTAFDRMTAQIGSASTKAATDWRKLERELTNGFAIVKKSANELFNKDLISGNLSGQSAKNSIFAEMLKKEEEAMKAAALASQQLENEIQSLTQKYNPLVAATQFYEREVENMHRAHELGITSAKQLQAQLVQLEREYQAINKGVYLAGSRFNQFGEMADGSGKSAQRFGMYAQQAGYQIGDFAVQVQGGTNVGVAFSQQMAQLAGLIPGVAGAVTTFAAIGLGILIQNLTRSEKEAKKAKEAYDGLGDTLSKLEDVRFDNITSGLTQAAQTARQEFESLFNLIEKEATKNLQNTLMKPLKDFAKQMEDFKRQNSLRSQMGLGEQTFDVMGFDNIGKATQAWQWLTQIQGDSREELQKNLELVTSILTTTGLMTPELQTQLSIMAEELGIVDSVNESLKEQEKSAVAIRDAYESMATSIADATREAKQHAELERLKQQYGETSLNYLEQQAQYEIENLIIAAQRAGIDQDRIDLLVQQQREMNKITIESEATKASTEQILGVLESISGMDISGVFSRAQGAASALLGTVNAIGRAMAAAGKLGLETEALKAQAEALRNGKTPGEAKVAGDVVRYGQTLPQGYGIAGDVVRGMLRKTYENQSLENLKWEEQIASDTKSYNDANKPGGGGKGRKGGKSDAEKAADKAKKAQEKINEKFVDFLEDFALRMEQQKRLVGVYGEQRDQLEKVIEIENRLGDARQLASQDQIEAWAREELALENLREMQDDIFNTISGNVENFLMEIVGGTETIGDAFRSLISSIISDLYQQLVAKPASNAIGSFVTSLFSAKGNAFGAGGVKMFANGGVVDSPTAFKYSGGLGVMGEAGPEAIMPLKRNSQGKLGVAVENASSGDIKVTQVFQFSANGDESVKAIIKQQLPKIQENTVQAVIEAKRRGRNGL